MQELCTDRWTDHFQLGRPRDISLWPKVPSSILLHGQSLDRLGRRPAREYWSEKDRPDFAVVRMTDSSHAHTTCHVMHACDPTKGVDPYLARLIVQMVQAEGHALAGLLFASGIVICGPYRELFAISMPIFTQYVRD